MNFFANAANSFRSAATSATSSIKNMAQQNPYGGPPVPTTAQYSATTALACPPDRNYPIDFPQEAIQTCEEPYQLQKMLQQGNPRIDQMVQAQNMVISFPWQFVNLLTNLGDIIKQRYYDPNDEQNIRRQINLFKPDQLNLILFICSFQNPVEVKYFVSRYLTNVTDAYKNQVTNCLLPFGSSDYTSGKNKQLLVKLLNEKLSNPTGQRAYNPANDPLYADDKYGQNMQGQYLDKETGELAYGTGRTPDHLMEMGRGGRKKRRTMRRAKKRKSKTARRRKSYRAGKRKAKAKMSVKNTHAQVVAQNFNAAAVGFA
jgi:hypothetical protein